MQMTHAKCITHLIQTVALPSAFFSEFYNPTTIRDLTYLSAVLFHVSLDSGSALHFATLEVV